MRKNSSILLVDDEQDILDILRYNLEREGFTVYSTNNGSEGFAMAKEKKPDLIVLDIMMPEIDGVELCRKIRADNATRGSLIAFLTARNEDYSQIAGFEAGADDYISKPLKPRVFVSRVKALLKRGRSQSDIGSIIEHDGVRVDTERVIVEVADDRLHLPKKEFELLVLLISKPGKVFKRANIYDEIWGSDQFVGDRTIDVHIRKLREKLGDHRIQTVKGVGYRFAE